jgi:hypothetical protein
MNPDAEMAAFVSLTLACTACAIYLIADIPPTVRYPDEGWLDAFNRVFWWPATGVAFAAVGWGRVLETRVDPDLGIYVLGFLWTAFWTYGSYMRRRRRRADAGRE